MRRILVVDDDPDIVLLLETILGQEGFRVTTAGGGAAALQSLGANGLPDLVVLDVQMPIVNGWTTLTAIRNDERTKAIPVVLCTVKASPRDIVRGWELGCDGYLTKPFVIEDIVAEMDAVLSRSPDERVRHRTKELEGAMSALTAR